MAAPEVRDWVEIIVPAAAADVDEVAALLADACEPAKEGTEVRGDEVVIWAPLGDQESALAEVRAAIAAFAEAGLGVDPATVRAQPALPEAEWRDAWKRYFHVTRITPRIVVVPSWEQHEAAPDDVIIALDPGMAFGTGTHASTRLVLEELQDIADREITPTRVLDVGCGSGILSIAAVKRWSSATCVAIDNDQLAVDATMDNAAVNRVADRIRASLDTLSSLDEQFPLVLANIQAHVLRELMTELIARVAVGGNLILSGLLTPQAEPLAQEFVAAGMRVQKIRASSHDPQWSSVTLTR